MEINAKLWLREYVNANVQKYTYLWLEEVLSIKMLFASMSDQQQYKSLIKKKNEWLYFKRHKAYSLWEINKIHEQINISHLRTPCKYLKV